MPTRLKRPAFWRHVALALGLIAFQGYLGYSVVTGQFGIESQDVLEAEIDELGAKSGALQAEIELVPASHRLVPDHQDGPRPGVRAGQGAAVDGAGG